MLLWFASGLLTLATAQDPELQRRANDAFQASDWEAARQAYAALAVSSPESALAQFRLAVSLSNLGQPAAALPLLARAEALGWPAPQAAFQAALAHARLVDLDAAFRELERAARAGFANLPLLDSHAVLQALRADARFAAARTAVDRNARPCVHDAKYRELDFWLGSWDVRPNGAPPSQAPASNVITKEHDGCVIHETWNAPGSNGQSFNIYDSSRGRWYQTWVDNSGGLHEYSGALEGGNMVYYGDLAPPSRRGARVRTRLTFFNLGPDTVRQLSERTADGGKTWSVNYDLIYLRRKDAPR